MGGRLEGLRNAKGSIFINSIPSGEGQVPDLDDTAPRK